MKLELTIDLTDTEYLNYEDEYIYKKDEFIFNNLAILISNISKHRMFDLTNRLCDEEINLDELKKEKEYIYNVIEPIIKNLSYALPNNENYNSITLILELEDTMTKNELLDIFKSIESHLLFHKDNINDKNNSVKDELNRYYNESLIIYERLVKAIKLIDFTNKSIDLEL